MHLCKLHSALLINVSIVVMTTAQVIDAGDLLQDHEETHNKHGSCKVHCVPLSTPSTPAPSRPSAVPAPVKLPCNYTVLAPDGSEVRVLALTPRISMANFRLGPGLVTIGVHHRTVDEVWYVTGGRGHIWRAPDGKPDEGEVDRLEPGMSVAIPVGTHFQFRADKHETLDIIGVDTPAWPGDDEAIVSTIAPWAPSVGGAR